ncbi:hypothetical protein [Hymenobacter sp. YC55]|uniref:hypothetical protein n=1 Tax=Hymenobacter sp. YC55 TaxID=3034019 RepID=UPI0023F97B53|nr:hypothetical protein [Hymenobacter sp. YC55]MDF7815207.1 hypothetical protein [Hymenobacter sp. YC55]
MRPHSILVMSLWLGACSAEPDHPARSLTTTGLHVVEVDPKLFRVLTDSIPSPTAHYYRIASQADRSAQPPDYPPRLPLRTVADTLQAIAHLLAFEHDTRRCGLPIMCWENLESSKIYEEAEREYSIQVEALFLINQLYYRAPFRFACYPALSDQTGQVQSIDGSVVHRAYQAYRAWFKRLKPADFAKPDGIKPDPLANSGIRWY